MGIYDAHTLAGYGIIEKDTGDIPQLAIALPYRREGLATTLRHALVQHNTSRVIRIINSDTAYTPFKKFMNSVSLQAGYGQYEMMRTL